MTAQALFELGNAQLERGEIKEAVTNLERAFVEGVRARLDKYRLQEMLQGIVMAALAASDWRQAVFYAKQATRNDPSHAENWHHLAAAYWGAGNWRKARRACETCLELDRLHIGAREQLAELYGMAGHTEGEAAQVNAATTLTARHAIERFQQSKLLIWLGRYEQGWAQYEERHALPLVINGWRQPTGLDPAKRWDGKAPVKHLLVYHEQGHGDAIQMARYHGMLDGMRRESDGWAMVADMTILVHPSLVSLFRGQSGDWWTVFPLEPGAVTPEHDAYVGAMSLPHIFGTTIDTAPPPADFGMRWERVGAPDQIRRMTRIALCTKGAPVSSLDLDRSCHDDSFDRLKQLEGYEFVDFTGRTGDYLDTARELLGCELLVTVDTSIAHLAGSIGMPVWLVPPTHFEWRHPRGAEVNPWYPTWRYFRRRKSNDWPFAVDRIIQALGER